MKIVLLSTLAACANAMMVTPEVVGAFKSFQLKFNKQYTNEEYGSRMAVFAENVARANALNEESILAGGEAVHGITKFMDLTPVEFKAMHMGYIPSNSTRETVVPKLDGPAADTIDWRKKGAVTEVKDQGQCGSCWAFSATEAIESYSFLNGGKLEKLSPQQINSCDTEDDGCNGGNTETAYKYVEQAGGIESNSEYPYTSGGGETGECKFKKDKIKVSINGFKSVSRGEDNLKSALNNGPVSVCLAADAFQSYTGGILTSCPGEIDHCVQAVGYEEGKYWIVRNSWGLGWGEEGYIRVAMGENLCHISDDVTYPTF